MTLEDDFKLPTTFSSKTLSNEKFLELYGLYKDGTVGDNTNDRPGFFDMKGKAKHDAWAAGAEMSKENAMTQCIETAKKIMEKHGTA